MYRAIAVIIMVFGAAWNPATAQVVTRSIDLNLPPPITETEFDRYAATLRVSPEEHAIATAFFEEYQFVAREEEQSIEDLRSKAIAVRALQGDTGNPSRASARAYADLMNDRDRVAAHMMEAEESLFAEIALLLDDHRSSLLEVVRVGRLAVWSAEIRASMPGVTLDMGAMFRTFAERAQLQPSEITATLARHYARLGPALRSRLFAAVEVGVKDRETLAERYFDERDEPVVLSQDEAMEADRALAQARYRIFERQARRDARVRDLNEELMLEAIRILPREVGRAMELAVLPLLVTEPGTYPDKLALDATFAAALEDEDATLSVRETMSAHYDEYLRAWRSVDRQIRAVYSKWVESTAAQGGYHIVDRQEYEVEMQSLLDRRAGINEHYRQLISSFLSNLSTAGIPTQSCSTCEGEDE